MKAKKRKFFNGHPELAMTQTELAKAWGCTPQCIQLIEKQALKKFKRRFSRLYPDTVPLILEDVIAGRW